MIKMREPLSRRTLLRGLGVKMALPMLEAMVPARASVATAGPKRLSIFYTPNGMIMPEFVPSTEGRGFTMPSTLASLEPFREKMNVVTGLGHYQASPFGDKSAGHGPTCPAFLTATHVKQTEGFDIRAGVSADQIVARTIGQETPFSSLELGIEPASAAGSCDINYSCAYTNGISWRTPTSPLPVTANPRVVFERLFADGALSEEERVKQLQRRTSVLDFVMEDAARLAGDLGANDKMKMEEYLEATRDVERRVQRSMTNAASVDLGDFKPPAGIPHDFEQHAKMMVDLQVLAFQADLTRVVTFMVGREISNRTYPEIGVPDAHHMLSHHGDNPEKMAKVARINAFHLEQYAYLLRRLSDTTDGDGTLLDRTVTMSGAAIGDSNAHDYMDLPVTIAGGLIKGGEHIKTAKDTPMANLLLSIMHLLDVPEEQFGDSTGPLTQLQAA
ncbi:MAG: DUF1552 domain-containing protein [Pseudomonadota bacterium]